MKKIIIAFLMAIPFLGIGQQQFVATDMVCWYTQDTVVSLIRESYKVNGLGTVVKFYDVQTNAEIVVNTGEVKFCYDTTAVVGGGGSALPYECLDTITQANSFVTNSVTSVYHNGTAYVAWDTLSPMCLDGYARGINSSSFELYTCGTWNNITSYGNGTWYAHSGTVFSNTAADTVEVLAFDVHGGKVSFYVIRCIKYFPANASTVYSSNVDSLYTQNDTLFVVNNDATIDTFYNTINTDTSGTAHIAADGDLSATNELITNFSIVGDSLSITEAGVTRRVAKNAIAPVQSANNGLSVSSNIAQLGTATNAASGTSADLTRATYIPMAGNNVSFLGTTGGTASPVLSLNNEGRVGINSGTTPLETVTIQGTTELSGRLLNCRTNGVNVFTVSRNNHTNANAVAIVSQGSINRDAVSITHNNTSGQSGVALNIASGASTSTTEGLRVTMPAANRAINIITGTVGINANGVASTIDFYQRGSGNNLSVFRLDATTTSGQGLLFNSSGNLMVANATVASRLYVKGSGNTSATTTFRVDNSDANNILTILDDRSATFNTGAGTGVNIPAGTSSWVSNSDRRLKENITPLNHGLNTVMAMKPSIYNYISTDKKSIGFIAQEMEEVVPEVVSENADGYLGISYTELIPVLVKAIQDQQEVIETLETRIKTLENK